MGPAYYVIAIFGCADGAIDCTPVATVPVRYESEAACSAATAPALVARTDLDFPTLLAECRATALPIADSDERPAEIPSGAMKG